MITFIQLFPELKDNLKDYKVHFAIGYRVKKEPLYAFFERKFKKWQEWQNQKNFERPYILSLIYIRPNEWLYAGIYRRIDVKWVDDHYEYSTQLLDINKDLIGRLIIRFEKKFRASYLRLERHVERFQISELLKEQYSTDIFPGYENLRIDFNMLSRIIQEQELSWKTALSNVKGIYLITDKKNGKQYIGSAYGSEAFWTRWANYTLNGHAGNKELKKLIRQEGISYANNFQFSILEVRSNNTDDDEILKREKHWKDILLTRKFGYNDN